MTTNEIRTKYLKFFESKRHKIVSSDSLIPANDPSVLFTGAGMNQFKDQFMGRNITYRRATSSQKCLRTGDLDKVGKTAGHHTFFEMLGNFSFGDYFKKEAITWAWEFMTEELRVNPERLWVSVYKDDDEAYKIWRDGVGVPEYKIKRYGADDNFWPANAPKDGPNGPCGPCSEIFYDQGEDVGCGTKYCEPSCSCNRFVEVWNLVFTQFNRTGKNNLEPLKSKNIDTGMGLERMAGVMQNVRTNFETDIFLPIVNKICESAGMKKGEKSYLVNAIADHIRAVCFMIADGILPSNEERGYVERLLIRRAFRFGKELDIELPFLYKLVPAVTKTMRDPYPGLESMREGIADVILNEEKRFRCTLEEGTKLLEDIISKLKNGKRRTIPGEDIFRLYDTYGFPVELTREFAEKKGYELDEKGFKKAMDRQRDLARAKSKIKSSIFDESKDEDLLKKLSQSLKPSIFTGYKKYRSEATVQAIVYSGKRVKSARAGARIELVLDKTPFYGEAGGQIGDAGHMASKNTKITIDDTKRVGNIIVHLGEIAKGSVKEKMRLTAIVDEDSRLDIARNHTATHLLHYALREVLGRHIKQSGSLVARERLRFDFTHFKAVEKRELDRIEELVNELVRANTNVSSSQLKIEEAKKKGAIALFGEKYGDRVRMVSIGNYSKELCGGTHLEHTGQIGLFRIVGEGSIASGIRRIEALTGRMAFRSVKDDEERIRDSADILRTQKGDVVKALKDLSAKVKSLEKDIADMNSGKNRLDLESIAGSSQEVSGIKVISTKLDADIENLRITAEALRNKLGSSIVVLGSGAKSKVTLVCAVSRDLVGRGLDASNIVKKISMMVGGSGGGRPDFAQAGGKDVEKLEGALKSVANIVQEELDK
ncbi:MAG: alanine--tRNA ligase [Candidatus Omnitrophica bacterium]|nr:alanine--tRNA ligase [Candidatus Omnitrophota bacterium]